MSFRIEEKLLINSNQVLEFKDFLFKKFAKEIYPSRKIKSLYFENFNEEMYKDSIEGTVPRKKSTINDMEINKFLKSKEASKNALEELDRISDEYEKKYF